MVTPQHEALHRIFRHDGELFARTVRHVLHEDVPVPLKVEILDTDMTEIRPHIRRGDSVLLAEFLAEDEHDRYIIIIESQLRKDDGRGRRRSGGRTSSAHVPSQSDVLRGLLPLGFRLIDLGPDRLLPYS
jgi:hypothetical protein